MVVAMASLSFEQLQRVWYRTNVFAEKPLSIVCQECARVICMDCLSEKRKKIAQRRTQVRFISDHLLLRGLGVQSDCTLLEPEL